MPRVGNVELTELILTQWLVAERTRAWSQTTFHQELEDLRATSQPRVSANRSPH